MSKRFLVALWALVFSAVCGTWPKAHAQVQSGSVFNSEGPAPTIGPANIIGSNDNPPNGTAAGAVQPIVVDPSNPSTMYVGAVNGGIWKTTNGGMNWTPLTDRMASLSIASRAFDPTDRTHQTLIAGTGLTSAGVFDSFAVGRPVGTGGLRDGLLYSQNGGATWKPLGETSLNGQSVVGVAALRSTVLAATFEPNLLDAFEGGLFRSSNSGATFTMVSGTPGTGLPSGPVSSLVSDPNNPNVFYAAVTAKSGGTLGQTSVYVSRNAGATWQPVFTGTNSDGLIPGAAAAGHQTFIRIAAAPNGALALGLVETDVPLPARPPNMRGQQLIGLFYRSSAGANWRRLDMPVVNLGGRLNPGGQAELHLALAIDPKNSNLIYVMGDAVEPSLEQDMPQNGGQNALPIFRVDAATNTVSPMSDDNGKMGNTANGSFVHPDGRAFAFLPDGTLLASNDTGLYARTNPESSNGVWKGLNGNLSTNEFYALAFDANGKRLVGGMQDNGEAYQAAPGKPGWNAIGGGDGVNAVVNDVTLGSESAIYVSSQELGLQRLIVDQNGQIISPPSPFDFLRGIPVSFDKSVEGVSFSSPFVLNNFDKMRIALAGSAVYVTQDTLTGANGPGETSVTLSPTSVGLTFSSITTIDYGTLDDVNALLAGGGGPTGLFLSTSATMDSLEKLTHYSGLAPTSVKFDLRSDQRFFVADSVDLFDSVNQGLSFQTLTGKLPANFMRPTSLAFLDSNGVDALFVGGLNNVANAGNPLAVADSDANGNLSPFRRFGSGLPNTIINSLSYNPKSDTLAVSAVGRGAYLLYDVTSNFASAKVLQFGLADNDSNPNPAILFGDRPLIKFGTGTLTINGSSKYMGTTTVLAGAMAAGVLNAFAQTSAFTVDSEATLDLKSFNQTIGSLAGTGIVTSNGMGATLTTGKDGTNTEFDGTIRDGSGTLGLTKIGLGTFTLTGMNTYSGGTLIQAGTLVAGTLNAAEAISFALGTRGVFLQAGILRTPSFDPLVINVGGNYTQGPGGTLELGVAGLNGKDYDRVQVGGNASLNGTLAVSSLNNFRPSSGDAFGILRTNGRRSGEFAETNDSLNNSPNLARVDVYFPNGVALVYVSGPSQSLTTVTPIRLPPIDPNAPLRLPLIAILAPTAEQLTSVYEISFSGANTQRFNLEERLAEIQRGSTGFASNLNVYTPPAPYQGKDSTSDDGAGKSAVEKQPVLQPTPENRWGVWVTGWGDFANVDDDNFTKGYEFTTGGVTLGIDYRLTDHLALGLFGSYSHTWTDLRPGSIEVNSGRGGLYATYFGRAVSERREGLGTFYLNGAVFGGYNSYDTSRQALVGPANGSSDGTEFSTFIGAGYDFHFGNLAFGPLTALQYSYVSLNGFSEHGSLVPLGIHSDSQDSLRTDLGLRASYTWHVGRVSLIPSLTAAWEHEYKYSTLPITASAPVFGGLTETLSGPSEGHDSAIVNAGVGVQWTPTISTYVGYQGQLGRDRYDSNAVSGGVSFSF